MCTRAEEDTRMTSAEAPVAGDSASGEDANPTKQVDRGDDLPKKLAQEVRFLPISVRR